MMVIIMSRGQAATRSLPVVSVTGSPPAGGLRAGE
ncbi:hypothetical protein SAMN05421870_114173 [Streptomyces qinglanensis]|uniref:Uncharacterized protein n=1 Tax=Streptomyces qinglanensis TaxID=943816 RepID=A0A1H9W211_9ACTN|nr:hypothetical protein SAMN05421870_114173 [Streptomyces qinglanensis]